MSYSKDLDLEELIEDSERAGKDIPYSNDLLLWELEEALLAELDIHIYSFLCQFRDTNVCPYFYEKRIFLFDDGRLYAYKSGPNSHQNQMYDLKEMNLSIHFALNKNTISLTDTIMIRLNPEDEASLKVLFGILLKNQIEYSLNLEAKDDMPRFFWAHDVLEYCYDIRRLKLLAHKDIKNLITGLYSYDPYLKKLMKASLDLGVLDMIKDEEESSPRSDFIEKLSSETGCTEEVAKGILDIFLTMKPDSDDWHWAEDFSEQAAEEIDRLYEFLEEKDLMDEYRDYVDENY